MVEQKRELMTQICLKSDLNIEHVRIFWDVYFIPVFVINAILRKMKDDAAREQKH